MGSAVAVTRAEWAVVSLHLPGYAKSIGVVLRDIANDHLHIQVNKEWWRTWDENVEICCDILEQIVADAREHGASAALECLDGSHVIRLSERRKIWVHDYGKTLKDLYVLSIAAARPRGAARFRGFLARCQAWEWKRLLGWCNTVPVFRYRYYAAIFASLLVVGVSLFKVIPPKPLQSVRTIQDFPVLPLPGSEISTLQVIDTPLRAHARHRRLLKAQTSLHRKFKKDTFDHVVVAKRHTVLPARPLATPPRYVAASYTVDSKVSLLLPPQLPRLAKFRVKHNRFVRALIAIGSPFRDGPKSASDPI